MTYKKIKTLTNVSYEFIVTDKEIIYLVRDGGMMIYNYVSDRYKHFLKGTKFYKFALKNKVVVLDTASSKINIFSIEEDILIEIEGYSLPLKIILPDGDILLTDENTFQTVKTSIKNFNKIWSLSVEIGILSHININSIYFTKYSKNNFLCKIDISLGSIIWEIDLGRRFYDFHEEQKKADINQIMGVWENQLLVSISNQMLVGIDINNGTILWEFEKPKEILADFTRNAHLDSEMGKIYFLTFNAFVEFDIQTKNIISTKSFWNGSPQTSWQFGHSYKQGDYIYFTASIGTAQFYYYLGVFHIPTMEIVWQYKQDGNETFNSMPQVSENNFYALDSGGNLHIFERK